MDQINRIIDNSPLHFVRWHGDLISFAVLNDRYHLPQPNQSWHSPHQSLRWPKWPNRCHDSMEPLSLCGLPFSFSICVWSLPVSRVAYISPFPEIPCAVPQTGADVKGHTRHPHPSLCPAQTRHHDTPWCSCVRRSWFRLKPRRKKHAPPNLDHSSTPGVSAEVNGERRRKRTKENAL